MGRLLELFQTSQQTDPQADALIAALRPICGQSGSGAGSRLSGWRASPGRLARPTRLWKAGELHL